MTGKSRCPRVPLLRRGAADLDRRGSPRCSATAHGGRRLDDPVARAVGLLCGRSGHADVVDVSVVLARGSGTRMSLHPIQRISVQSMTPSSCTCHEGTRTR